MTCEKNQSAVCRFENMKEEGGVALEFWQHGFLNKWVGEAQGALLLSFVVLCAVWWMSSKPPKIFCTDEKLVDALTLHS